MSSIKAGQKAGKSGLLNIFDAWVIRKHQTKKQKTNQTKKGKGRGKNMFNNVWVYMTSWLLAFLVGGVVFYILDRAIHARIYLWWYNLTHQTPLAKGSEKGLIYNQSTKKKFLWAFIVSTAQSALVFWGIALTLFNPLVEVSLWLLEVPVMVLGMLMGPKIHNWWSRRFELYHYIDDVEAGKVHLDEEMKGKIGQFTDGIKKDAEEKVREATGWFAKLCAMVKNFIWPKPIGLKPNSVVRPTASGEKSSADKPIDPREAIKKFAEGK